MFNVIFDVEYSAGANILHETGDNRTCSRGDILTWNIVSDIAKKDIFQFLGVEADGLECFRGGDVTAGVAHKKVNIASFGFD